VLKKLKLYSSTAICFHVSILCSCQNKLFSFHLVQGYYCEENVQWSENEKFVAKDVENCLKLQLTTWPNSLVTLQ